MEDKQLETTINKLLKLWHALENRNDTTPTQIKDMKSFGKLVYLNAVMGQTLRNDLINLKLDDIRKQISSLKIS